MKASLYDHCVAVGKEDVLAQWHPTRNGELTPKDISSGSTVKVWWRCPQGHEWQSPVYTRTGPTRNDGCPVCAGKIVLPGFNDLASHAPDIANQWHPTQNGELKPDCISPYSNRKVWWVCGLGHEFQSTVAHRTRMGSGCPYCAGRKVLVGFNDLTATHPDVAKQWHSELNGELTPDMVTAGSNKKIWWECSEGHVWKTVVYSRTGPKKCGCPVCSGRISVKQPESVV